MGEITMMSDVNKHFQTLEEVTKGTVEQNGTWLNTMILRRLSWTADMDHEEIPIVGREDPHSDESLFLNGTLSIEGYFWDTRFMRYCTELAVGTGTIAKTNTACFGYKQGGTNMTRVFYGLLCDSCEITIGKIHTFSGQFKVMDISPLMTDAQVTTAFGGTYVPAPAITSRPLTHRNMTDTTEIPFSYGGVERDISGATIRVSRNAYVKDPLGSTKGTDIKHANRRTEVSLEFWHEDDVPFDDVVGNVQKDLVIMLKATATTDTKITVNDFLPFTKPQDLDAGSTEPIRDSVTGSAAGLTVDELIIAQ
jgi:hypothetical protein